MVEIPNTYTGTFVSLYQLNDRFIDDQGGNEFYEYAEMQLIVTKVIKMPPHSGKNMSSEMIGECAFVDGVTQDMYNSCHLKINKMTAGTYIFFYTANFSKTQLCRRLNVILQCPA